MTFFHRLHAHCFRIGLWICGCLGLAVGPHSALAQVFVVDTNQSSLTLSGNAMGSPLTQQGPGSLTAHYTGTIQTSLGANIIQFTGQSLVLGLDSGNWEPRTNATAGKDPANYGILVTPLLTTGKAAMRKLQFDLFSADIPVNNGQFDPSSVTFLFPTNGTATAAFLVTGLIINTNGVDQLIGTATNANTTAGTLVTLTNRQTLTLPVDATFLLSLVSSNDTTVRVTGQLVAVRSVAPTRPLIQSVSVRTQVVTLQWQDTPGLHFQVQSSADLTTWRTNAADVTSAASAYSWSGPATNPAATFRLAK